MKMVKVRKYVKKDGTKVSQHTRHIPESDLKYGAKNYSGIKKKDSESKEKSMKDLLKKEFPDVIHYKNRVIKVQQFGDKFKAYVPFGGHTSVEKSKAEAISNTKYSIDKLVERQKEKEKSFKLKFKDFKRFYFKVIRDNPRTYGGRNVTVEVLEQTKDGLKNLGEVKWQTASYKGEESEVLDYLKKIGKISKGMFPDGYYGWSDAEKYNVKISRL